MKYEKIFFDRLNSIREENRYREFVPLTRMVGNLPYAIWHCENEEKEIIVWCSNDYLGMSHHPKIVDAFKNAAITYGVGSGGTRNISGTSHPHVILEKLMADLHEKESSLLFSSGYAANEGALSALSRAFDDLVIFSDEKNHASMIRGIRAGKAECCIFKHNNVVELEEKLKSYPLDRPKLIVVESVYSMHGDFSPLSEICSLAKKYQALLYVDEVHAMGLYGEQGDGLVAQMGLTDQVDIIQGNFAKGYGVVGGYIASSSLIIDYIRSVASSFIFTTSLPPAITVANIACVDYLMKNKSERQLFWKKVNFLKKVLSKTDVNFVQNSSHIVPIVVGDALKCKQLAKCLLDEYGIYVQPINFPTVPRGEEMIRITVTPYHTDEMIYELANALQNIWVRDILKAA